MFNFLALLDIRVFGRLYITIVASDWPRTFFTPKVFLFSINIYTYTASHIAIYIVLYNCNIAIYSNGIIPSDMLFNAQQTRTIASNITIPSFL